MPADLGRPLADHSSEPWLFMVRLESRQSRRRDSSGHRSSDDMRVRGSPMRRASQVMAVTAVRTRTKNSWPLAACPTTLKPLAIVIVGLWRLASMPSLRNKVDLTRYNPYGWTQAEIAIGATSSRQRERQQVHQEIQTMMVEDKLSKKAGLWQRRKEKQAYADIVLNPT